MIIPYVNLPGAVAALLEGHLVVYPTETFYAVGCDALNEEAVRSVYISKHRLNSFPLPVIIGDLSQLPMVAGEITPEESLLMDAFWPGPLSIILSAAPGVPPLLCGATGKVAVRFSSHPGARELAMAVGKPLVASSANISGRPPVTVPEQLDQEFLQKVLGVYQAPPAPAGGQPSTVVEVIASGYGLALRIVRHGAVTRDALAREGFTCCLY